MKNRNKPARQLFNLIMITTIALGCTKNFEKYNTNPNALPAGQINYDNVYLGGFFRQMEESIFPVGGTGSGSTNAYQRIENLCGDIFGGYHGQTHNWNAAGDHTTYNFTAVNWKSTAFNLFYSNIIKNYDTISKYAANNPDIIAVAKIIKVQAAHRVVDMYGPLPYFNTNTILEGGATYDPVDSIYYSFFRDLDSAITVLKPFAAIGATPLANFDAVYLGNYTAWIRFANSLKLRLAMRIVYANAEKARQYAEAAVNDDYGLITENTQNAVMRGVNVKYGNPLSGLTNDYNEARMSATMESILTGYKDPRMPAYFQPATFSSDPPDTYRGIMLGIIIPDGSKYLPFSKLKTNFDVLWMPAAETYFLRAEGALRNWNMKGTAKELYEQGIEKSFEQWSVGAATAYLENESKPLAYKDPVQTGNKSSESEISTITVKWSEGATFENKLERILTQKWIAIYPNGQEAWSEFRRTGYPRLIPVDKNLGNDSRLGDPNYQVKRLPYPSEEYQLNADNVAKGVELLGGPDLGGTKLWWDKKP